MCGGELNEEEKQKSEKFLKILSGLTNWNYKKENWQWDNLKIYQFSKFAIKPRSSSRVNRTS